MIGIIAAIGALIVVFIVWSSNGSDRNAVPVQRSRGSGTTAIICPRNATPENSKERDCIRVSTFQDVTYWTCSD